MDSEVVVVLLELLLLVVVLLYQLVLQMLGVDIFLRRPFHFPVVLLGVVHQ